MTTIISYLSWGQMIVTTGSETHRFKDCKIWPGGVRAWDWNETGTRHAPGIQPADLQEILEHNPEIIILGCGMLQRLGVCPETEELLRSRGLPYHLLATPQAVELYNDLARQGKRVGGVFHSTC